jgi:hypothetical protein
MDGRGRRDRRPARHPRGDRRERARRRGRAGELVPAGILDKLPAEGIVVVASARPGPADAARTPSASAGLRLGDAEAATLWHGPEGRERAYAEYVLRAERDGLDLDVRVYVGDAEPPPRVLAEAQAQLDRLVVRAAASQVTMAVRPTVLNFGQAPAIWGAVSAGRAGEVVMLEMELGHVPAADGEERHAGPRGALGRPVRPVLPATWQA